VRINSSTNGAQYTIAGRKWKNEKLLYHGNCFLLHSSRFLDCHCSLLYGNSSCNCQIRSLWWLGVVCRHIDEELLASMWVLWTHHLHLVWPCWSQEGLAWLNTWRNQNLVNHMWALSWSIHHGNILSLWHKSRLRCCLLILNTATDDNHYRRDNNCNNQLQTTKEAEKLQTVCAFNWNVGGVPVLFMYVRMPVYFFESNLWSGPLCGIARNSLSILFEIRFYEKVSLEKSKAGMLCGFGLWLQKVCLTVQGGALLRRLL